MIDKNLIREGLIATINSDYTCDVYFPDQDYTASGLKVLNPGGTRNKDHNLPNVNDLALCVFIPPSLTDGWILGFGYNNEDKPPVGDENIHSTSYSDGTVVSYDTANHVLSIKCNGDVKLNCNNAEVTAKQTTITSPTKINGDLTVEGNIKSTVKVTAPSGEFGSSGKSNGGLIINGKDWKQHIHSAGNLQAPNGAVSGTTGNGE